MKATGGLRRFFDSSMRANAVALVANQLASASLGFVYWLLAARLYPVEVVGMSAAVISTVQLVSGLAQLGLANGLQRFLPRAGRRARRLAVASYVAVTAATLAAGVIALLADSALAPGRSVFGDIPPAFIVLAAVAWTLFYLQDGVLIGLREAVWVFVENFAYNFAKIVLLVVGAQMFAGTGIVASWFLPAPVAVTFVSLLIFGRLLRPERLRDHEDPSEHVTAREIITSASADHVGGMVAEAGLRFLPLLVVRLAGVEANAYFYQAWMIAAVLGLVASGMANSFTAETAADRRRVGPNSRAILRTMGLLLIPAALVVGLAAPLVLRVFGESYAREGAAVLRVLALAVAPLLVNTWYVSYLRVVGHTRKLIAVRVIGTLVLVLFAWAGLTYFGIVGVGIAWLVSQSVVAAYALFDGYELFGKPASRAQRERKGALRRGDWRFLLPAPHPRTVAVFGDGVLARSVQLLDAETVEGGSPAARDCDLAVVGDPDNRLLADALAALRPGGTCYAEWRFPRVGGTSSAESLLANAGFEQTVMYWPAPRASRAKLWVRIPTPSASYRAVLDRLLTDASTRPWMGRAIAALTNFALRIGFVPTAVSLAKKPIAEGRQPSEGESRSHTSDFSSWLEARLEDVSGESGLMVLMRTGGESDYNKVNWLVFSGAEGRLSWIAKAPRHPASLPALEREYHMLEVLDARDECRPDGIEAPRAVLRTEEAGFPLFIQTAVQGTPLLRYAMAEGYGAAAVRLAGSLATLADPSNVRPSDEWWAEHVGRWLDRLESQLAGIGAMTTVERARALLGGFTALPLGWTHNDCTPWNTMVTAGGLSIFDWESADERGLPAVDLVYALATTAFSLDGTESTPNAIDSYRRLMDPQDERGRTFCSALEAYGAAVGIGAEDLSRLRVATWLLHSTHDLGNLLQATDDPTSALLGECVCLPILQTEINRHEAAFTAGRAATPHAPPAHALFISPHLDDAVLSCGAAINRLVAGGTNVEMVTVFTEDLPTGQKPSTLARSCHEIWGGSPRPFADRRDEDRRAADFLNVHAGYLGFRDAVYRLGPSGKPIYEHSQRAPIPEQDLALLIEPLSAAMRDLVARHPDSVVFCPAGRGGHVDHLIVRRAVESATPARLVYYDEYPYLSWDGGRTQGGMPGSAPFVLRPSPGELEAQLVASACYVSQIPGLFPSPSLRLRRIVRKHLPRMCAWIPVRPDDAGDAMRRMEARVRRDKTHCGERYSWSDVNWSGPFSDPS